MSNPFRVQLRRLFVIVMTIALMGTTFAPVLAQQATPILNEPTETVTSEQAPDRSSDEEAGNPAGTPSPEILTETTMSTPAAKSSMIEPYVATEGTLIYIESTTPDSCTTSLWNFSIENGDPSINFITVQFSNGEIMTVSASPGGSFTSIFTHLQYTVVNAWMYSELPDSTATLSLSSGPCNNQIPEGQTYDATFYFFLSGSPVGVGAFDNVTWSLFDEEMNSVQSGSLEDIDIDTLTIHGLTNGTYTIAFTDSTDALKPQNIQFVIEDESFYDLTTFFRATGQTPFKVSVQAFDSLLMVEGASVRIVSSDGSVNRTELTNPSGIADFGSVPPGTYWISIERTGYAPLYLENDIDGPDLTIVTTLTKITDRTLSGLVADLNTEETITGATITLSADDPFTSDIVTSSDDTGNYSITAYNSDWIATVSAPGYLPINAPINLRQESKVFNAFLQKDPAQWQEITLQVDTIDTTSPAGSTYIVAHGQDQVASGTLDNNGSVDLGELLVGEQYEVLINDAPVGYLNANASFTVKEGEPTWTVTLQAMPDVKVEVLTDDGGSPVGLPFTYSIDNGPVQEGVLDSSALISIGKLAPGTRVDVTIDARGSLYNSHELVFTVNANQNTWSLKLRNNAPEISLEVTTRDGGTPEGATYLVMLGEEVLTTGTLDENGQVNLGELPIYETYEVIIDGAQTGYGGTSREFKVYQSSKTWSLVLDPLPAETTTANVTLHISTSDGGSPEGATFTISEAQPQAASTGFIGGSLQQVTTPITGTIPADGSVLVGDLTIGATYILSISGEVAGYNDLTTTFTVDAASPNVDITLVALQPEETVTPTPSPSATEVPVTETPTATTGTVTETPSPSATDVPATETPSPSATMTEVPITATPTTPAGGSDAPGAPDESDNATAPQEVSALPSTGAGSDSIAVIVLMATGLMLVAIAVGFVIRRGDHR